MRKIVFLIVFALLLSVIGCKIESPGSGNGTTSPDIETVVSTSLNSGTPSNSVESPDVLSLLEGGELMPGILGTDITAAVFDQDNVLWIGSYKGLDGVTACYQGQFKVFDRYNTNWPQSTINQIVVDKQNIKWFTSGWGAVIAFDNHNWAVLPTPGKVERLDSMKAASNGMIWVSGKVESENGKPQDAIWSYQDRQLDKIFYADQFGGGSLSLLTVDSHNFVYVMGESNRIYRYNGDSWDQPAYSLPFPSIRGLYFNLNNNVLYCVAYKPGTGPSNSQSQFEAGIFLLSENGAVPINPEINITLSQLKNLKEDNQGNLWIGLGSDLISDEHPLMEFDGKNILTFGTGSIFAGWQIDRVITAGDGKYWIWGKQASQDRDILASASGNTWLSYPVLIDDPRIWWRNLSLAELYQYPVTEAAIQNVLKNPVPYRGEKLRVIGKIETSFEYGNVLDIQGNRLNLWLSSQNELNAYLQNHPATKPPADPYGLHVSDPVEMIGFLESGRSYGPYTYFYLTEMYPCLPDGQPDESAHQAYAEYINTLIRDRQEIEDLLNRWTEAMKSGDVATMLEILNSEGFRYQSLLWRAQQSLGIDPMDITIKKMFIRVLGDTAYAAIQEAVVKPARYYTSTGNIRVKGDGLFVLRSVQFKKVGTEWKVNDFDYSPDYDNSALTPPVLPTGSPLP
jgi:hypothetical protein